MGLGAPIFESDFAIRCRLLSRVRHQNIRNIESAAAGVLLGERDRNERKRDLIQGVVRNGSGNFDLRRRRRSRYSKRNLDGEGLIARKRAARGVEAAILDLVVVGEEQGQERRVLQGPGTTRRCRPCWSGSP